MTRQTREYWLDIAYHLNISPRQQDELTVTEWAEAVSAVEAIREESKKD